MTLEEKDALFKAVQDNLDTAHHRRCFMQDNFPDYIAPCEYVDGFTQWFLDNGMGGSLMADLNSQYGCNLTLTYNN